MKNILRNLFLSVLFCAAGSLVFPGSAFAAEGKYYTKVNIWYEKPEKILTTNYHKGAMIPIGSEVEVVKSSKKKITFREKETGTEFNIELAKKYTPLTEQEFFDRYFSKDNVLKSGPYQSLSLTEKDAVKNGTIEKGMSKEAVLLAYGHPPTHRTPSTKQNTWTYWKSRYGSFLVQFKGDKVTSVGSAF